MFGTSKNNLDKVLVNTFNNKKLFKKAFHDLMGAIKENKESREFFLLYSQIENKKFKDKKLAEEYLTQVIKTLKEKKKGLYTETLDKTLKKFKNYLPTISNPIYENLDLLVFNESVNKIEEKMGCKSEIISHLTKPKSSVISEEPVSNSILIKLATRKFNDKFSNLSENDKKQFRDIFIEKKESLKKEYSNMVESTTTKLNSLIDESKDKDLVSKLQEVRNKISQGNFTPTKFLKIKELKQTLLG